MSTSSILGLILMLKAQVMQLQVELNNLIAAQNAAVSVSSAPVPIQQAERAVLREDVRQCRRK